MKTEHKILSKAKIKKMLSAELSKLVAINKTLGENKWERTKVLYNIHNMIN